MSVNGRLYRLTRKATGRDVINAKELVKQALHGNCWSLLSFAEYLILVRDVRVRVSRVFVPVLVVLTKFSLRQILEHRRMFCGPTVSVFIDFKAMFGSIDCAILWGHISLKCALEKFTLPNQSLHASGGVRIRAYGNLSSKFTIKYVVRQHSPISSFRFNFVIEMVMAIDLFSGNNGGIGICLERNLWFGIRRRCFVTEWRLKYAASFSPSCERWCRYVWQMFCTFKV